MWSSMALVQCGHVYALVPTWVVLAHSAACGLRSRCHRWPCRGLCLWTNRPWVKALPSLLLWTGGGGVARVIYLLGGIIEASVRCACRWGRLWDESPTRVLLTTMMVSADVSPLHDGFVGALLLPCLCTIFRFSSRSCSLLCCACVCFKLLFAFVCPVVMVGVATIVWLFVVDTFAAIALLWRMVCRRCCSGG